MSSALQTKKNVVPIKTGIQSTYMQQGTKVFRTSCKALSTIWTHLISRGCLKACTMALLMLTFAPAGNGYEEPVDPVALAEGLLDQGDYTRFLRIMLPVVRSRSLPAGQRAQAAVALASFYENFAGDMARAAEYYQTALSLAGPDDHPLPALARAGSERLSAHAQKYREHDMVLQDMLKPANAPPGEAMLRQRLAALEKIRAADPHYYRMAEVYYVLGDTCLQLQRYGPAYRHLQKARELRPAIDRYLAIEVKAAKARAAWQRGLLGKGLWTLLVLLLAATIVLFYRARPWQWLTAAHLLWGAAAILAWIGVFYGASFWLGARCVQELALVNAPFDRPYFLFGTPGSPGSHALLRTLLQYGLVCSCGIYLFSIGLARLRSRLLAAVAGAAFSLVLCSTMIVLFYLQHGDNKCRPVNPGGDAGSVIGGALAFIQSEPEPLLLTNPTAYPGIDVDMIADEEQRRWYMKYHAKERGH